jgi:hypothetical protein
MAQNDLRAFGVRRVYESTRRKDGATALRLHDRMVELGAEELAAYTKLVEWLPTTRTASDLAADVGMDERRLQRFASRLADGGLLYRRADVPQRITGREFFERHFSPILESWLSEAFSHPFWEKMMSGRGSARLYAGWTFELYHYTKNCNRHMPLCGVATREKGVKLLHAKHYAEEWNHYHFFAKSLRALGYTDAQIDASVPLPMTTALSNFMRQAAREDSIAYSICSAVLEGTTVSAASYDPYHEQVVQLYRVPRGAIQPIYDHLDLDKKYAHKNLFEEVLGTIDEITAQRAGTALDYGHQLVEHIWTWTDSIDKYYGDSRHEIPRRPFDPFLD